MSIVITSFYDFFYIDNLEERKLSLLKFCNENSIKGTILISSEGLNTTLAGSRDSINGLYIFIENLFNKTFFYKESYDQTIPFGKMKVKIKPEIVTMGVTNLDINNRGEYVSPEDWDEFISRPDVVLIDTRNNYEFALGSFEGSIDPSTDNFRQLPQWLDKNSDLLQNKKIAMFCTAGIRCEKSTSYLKNKGYEEVYHLKGGVLEYFAKTNNQSQKWKGDCFIFDDRMALDNNLSAKGDIYCNSCTNVITTDDIKRIKGSKQEICYECFK